MPLVIWQSPEQQVLLSLHTSPVWMQNEEPSLQKPPLHRLEQHWVLSVQGLPAVKQAELSGRHTPPVQLPPQHEAESVQACPSAVHALALQRPPAHSMEQHSVDTTQAPPAVVHKGEGRPSRCCPVVSRALPSGYFPMEVLLLQAAVASTAARNAWRVRCGMGPPWVFQEHLGLQR